MVVARVEEGILRIKLDRPAKSNAYNREMAESLRRAFEQSHHEEIQAVVIEASGRNFCAGADLDWMRAAAALSDTENLKDMAVIVDMYNALQKIEVPVIGLIQGKTRGGGLGLVSCLDIAICAPDADFALPEAKWGFIPGIITPLVAEKIGTSRFRELALSTRTFSAEEAFTYSLVHHLVPHAQQQTFLESLITEIKTLKRSALIETKRSLRLLPHAQGDGTDLLNKFLQISAKMRKGDGA